MLTAGLLSLLLISCGTGVTDQENTPATRIISINLGITRAFIVKGERTILVDAGMSGDGPKIIAALKANHIVPESVALMVLTHAHFDHVGSINYLREQTKAPVAVGRGDADALRTGENPPMARDNLAGWVMGLVTPPGRKLPIKPFEPEVIIDDPLDLAPYGVAGRILPTPGHTAGSISVLTTDGTAIVGDLMMAELMTLGGGPVIAPWAWNRKVSIESIRYVLDFNPDVFLVAHGGPFAPRDVADQFGTDEQVSVDR